MAFGKEIKRLREKERMSARKLAAMIGVNVGRFRKWEEKDYDPRDEDARKIEQFFKMSLDEVAKLDSIKEFVIVPRETSNNSMTQDEAKDKLIASYEREIKRLEHQNDISFRAAIETLTANHEVLKKLEQLFPSGDKGNVELYVVPRKPGKGTGSG